MSEGSAPSTASLGWSRLGVIIWTSLASSIYFSLGVVSGHALGLTPLVYLIAGLFFALTAMTYLEGAKMHPERAGSTVFARYAFNELVSFVAAAAVLLDYVILIAVCALTAADYLATFVSAFGHGAPRVAIALGVIAYIAISNVFAISPLAHGRRMLAVVGLDLVIQLLVIVVGLVLFFHLPTITDHVHLGSAPSWTGVVYALTLTTVAFMSLESASGVSGELSLSRASVRRISWGANLTIVVVYVGMAIVAVTAVPVLAGHTPLAGRYLGAPVIGIVERFHPLALADTLKYTVAAAAFVTLIAAARGAMLGLSRLAFSLATNRQVPSALGRLHPQRSTPYVLITVAALAAGALVLSADLNFLFGIFAFGSMLAFTIAHTSICVLRYREPDRPRPYQMPGGIRWRGGVLPLPAVLGALLSGAGWITVIVLHQGARYVGLAWILFGVVFFVLYRKRGGKALSTRVTVSEAVLRARGGGRDFGSILVPLLGGELDDDIVQTAALLVSPESADVAAIDPATIEALWIFRVPMSLPIDAPLPEAQLKAARVALARAKLVGEEYDGVEVATATVRARRFGQAIVEEAQRRGVEAIVLAAEEGARARAGTLLGGRTLVGESTVSETIRYVVARARCRVILTAPARAGGRARQPAADQ
ncbi:MAG TPA: APC family permease [Solirubrobacteraceae bacterium]|nr:APC family permease [Solirubrobacteraceae bacterium]